MKRIKIRLDRLSPVGINAAFELKCVGAALAAALLWGSVAPLHIVGEFMDFKELLNAGVFNKMPGFSTLFGGALYGFAAVITGLCALAVWHWLYPRLGARSDYTLRRLPRRSERYVRAFAIPLAGIVISALLAAIVLLASRALYTYMRGWALRGVTLPAGMEDMYA